MAGPAIEAIAPSRVVAVGPSQAAPRATMRVCPRCRGSCDVGAQFCKFCGASLGDASVGDRAAPAHAFAAEPTQSPVPPLPATSLPATVPPAASPASSMPDTRSVDPAQYRDYAQERSASSSVTMPPAATPTISPPPSAVSARISPAAASVPTGTLRGRVVIIARDGGEGQAFPLGEVTDIGRTEGNILVAEDRYVSPRHARLTRRGNEVHLRDLGSVNGVYVRIASSQDASQDAARSSGGPHAEAVPLTDQDLFLVGQQVLRFEVVKDGEEGFGAASQHGTLLFGTPASPRYARLSQRTVEGVVRDVFYIRKAETVLGRESGDIVFTDDPFLSRRHAAIRFDAAQRRFTLADLGSSNGTFLQIRDGVRLKDGDHFRVGQQLFRIDIDRSDIERVTPSVPRS